MAGEKGPAAQFAMELLCNFAEVAGAKSFVDVRSAHIGAAWLSGEAQFDFVERIRSLGGCVSIPTMLAASKVCLSRPAINQDPGLAARSGDVARMLVEIGCQPTFTCTPY